MPYDATDIETLGLAAGLRLLLEDADRIEALPPEQFDMQHVIAACGSPSCLGGWVRFWDGNSTNVFIEYFGARRWKLNVAQTERLMFPHQLNLKNGQSAFSATPSQAAQAMRNLAYSEAANPGHGDPMWETVE